MLVSSPTPHDILIQLAQHTGLFALLALVFSQIIHASRLHRSRWRPVLLGGTFGAFAILCMMVPVTIAGGMIVDGRIVMTALSGMLGGPVAAAIAGAAAASYRIWLGGPSALAACAVILISTLAGTAVWWLAARRARRARFRDLVLLAGLVAVLGQLPILMLPSSEMAWTFVTLAALPLALSTGGGIVVLGGLLLIELRRLVEEDKLRLLAAHATDIISRSDQAGRHLYVSPACREILGFDAEELVGSSIDSMVHPDDLPSVRAVMAALTPQAPRQILTCRVRRKDGGHVWVEVTLRLVPATSSDTLWNGPAEIVSVARDISKRKAVEAQLAAAKTQAEAASRAKSGFLANMSHELRTPLNAIIGFAELIRTETMGPVGNRTYCDYAKDIHDSGHHLLSLINDVLDLSKIEADRMVLDEETVDLNAVVATCIRMSRTQATRGGVTLEARVDPEAAVVRGEQRRLVQVLLNLVSNAIKYTKPGGSVRIATRMRPDGCLDLSVSDTGCGIDERDLAAVMQPFGQIDNPYNRTSQGTGLGLPLARRLVEMHDGRLALESKVGVGTTATVTLPAVRVIEPVA
ncbi:PAS domain S-box protein [Skermanella rosea]|uniref:ATP-binding protein n=1 Tax=Skermanella rosea TaxID=1817965 RepID=UPI00193359DB|nr:ATP-binding protein [Skermanella rosea]UEM04000.1 PAS domain S-box protein [Skermanella rosea]